MFHPLLTWKAFPRPLSSRSSVRQFPPPENAAKHVTFCSIPHRATPYPVKTAPIHRHAPVERKSVQPLKATKENFFGNNQVFANPVSVFCSYGLLTNVVDLHRFDADPDPDLTFPHFDADPDRNPDSTIISTHVGKSEISY
jgi:hypothetical protein